MSRTLWPLPGLAWDELLVSQGRGVQTAKDGKKSSPDNDDRGGHHVKRAPEKMDVGLFISAIQQDAHAYYSAWADHR